MSVWPPNFFEQFWAAYPRRVAKKAAVAALDRVRRSEEVTFDNLLDGVRIYARSVAGKDPQYIAHPATWLNGARWDDEPAALGGQNAYRRVSGAESWAERSLANLEGNERPRQLKLVSTNTRTGR
jgi:hypothetical protein